MLLRTCTLLFSLLLLSACGERRTARRGPVFDVAQTALVTAAGPAVPMRVWKIDNYRDSLLLRTASEPIRNFRDPQLTLFTDRLLATVRDSMSLGVGIAAPQVGILKRIVWVQRFDKPDFPFEVYFNPEIIRYSDDKQTCREGCLSIPGRSDTLRSRAERIGLRYQRADAEQVEEEVAGFTAVIFQHEIDHLNGILYLDHLARERAGRK